MKKRLVIIAATGAGLVLAVAAWVRFERGGPSPKIIAGLGAQDPAQIERAVSCHQWFMVRDSLTHLDFKFVFSSPFLELWAGRVREIGPRADRPMIGLGGSVTNASTCAYALVFRRGSPKCMEYQLTRTTNGWEVGGSVIYCTNDFRL